MAVQMLVLLLPFQAKKLKTSLIEFLKNDEWPWGGVESTKIHLSFLISRLLACWCSNMSLCHSMIHLYRDPGVGLSLQPEL